MPVPASARGLDLTNLLLGLAWLGELDRRQIQRLWFVGKSESTVEKTLARLGHEGVLKKRAWSIHDEARGVTAPQLARWSLTPAGHALVKRSQQYPAKPAVVRPQRLIAHDARTTEVIVRLIEIGRRSQLSGIAVSRELRLSPRERRPVCDALVVMQFGVFAAPNVVPWSSDPALTYEGRIRFAIEADNGTEPAGVLAAKAEAYRQLDEQVAWRTWWTQQYGPLPMPLWVAPTEARAAAIHAQWAQVWPDGCWLVATDTQLAAGRALYRRDRDEQYIILGFERHRPAIPPPTPALPAEPAPRPPAHAPAPPPAAEAAEPAPATESEMPPADEQPAQSAPAPTPARPGSAANPIRVPGVVVVREPAIPPPPPRPWYRRWADAALGWLWELPGTLVMLLLVAGGMLLEWLGTLDDDARRLALRLGLVTAIVAGGAGLWHARPAWLLDPWRDLIAAVEQVSAPVASPEQTPAPPAEPTPAPPMCVASDVRTTARLKLRTEPGLRGTVLRVLAKGERLTRLDCDAVEADGVTWWRVAGEDGVRGWAATTWLREAERQPRKSAHDSVTGRGRTADGRLRAESSAM